MDSISHHLPWMDEVSSIPFFISQFSYPISYNYNPVRNYTMDIHPPQIPQIPSGKLTVLYWIWPSRNSWFTMIYPSNKRFFHWFLLCPEAIPSRSHPIGPRRSWAAPATASPSWRRPWRTSAAVARWTARRATRTSRPCRDGQQNSKDEAKQGLQHGFQPLKNGPHHVGLVTLMSLTKRSLITFLPTGKSSVRGICMSYFCRSLQQISMRSPILLKTWLTYDGISPANMGR